VYLDGRLGLDLAAVVVDQAGLRCGDRLSADRQSELSELDVPYRARERALRLLGLRDRSRRELERRLHQAGFSPEVVAETLLWLSDLGYVDDRRFAGAYAAEKRRTGWGSARVRAELAGKGVERSLIDEVLADTEPPPGGRLQGEDVLEQLVRRRFSAQFAADPDDAERRLAGFLGRRGYDWDTIGRMTRMLRAEAMGEGRTSSIP
jgi:regulatory protein